MSGYSLCLWPCGCKGVSPMKKLLSALLIVLILLAGTAPALASDGDPHHHLCQDVSGDGNVNGQDFAQHVVDHALAGTLGAEHNPGMHHQGFSICVTDAP